MIYTLLHLRVVLFYSFSHSKGLILNTVFYGIELISRPKSEKIEKIQQLFTYNAYPIIYKK